MGPADTCIFVHRDHPPPPVAGTRNDAPAYRRPLEGWDHFRRGFLRARWAQIGRGLPPGPAVRRSAAETSLATVSTTSVSVFVSLWSDEFSVIQLLRSIRQLLTSPLRVSGGRVQI